MKNNDELLAGLIEKKDLIQNNNYDPAQLTQYFKEIESIPSGKSLKSVNEKSNLIKSFFITFNANNFSDFTVLFINSSDNTRIIEYAGIELIYDEFRYLINADPAFYKEIERIKFKENSYRIFFESMENDNGIYTILTITESVFFKPSKFHMLCDILMEIVRSADMSRGSIYNDLFEDTVVGISSFISSNNITESEFYLFKFENIYDFFLKMGLEIIIELSETIKKILKEFFGDRAAIFRFSLSEYIVITPDDFLPGSKSLDLNNSNSLYFVYKGIILKHLCIKIPYQNDHSIYDIFENIFNIDNNIKK